MSTSKELIRSFTKAMKEGKTSAELEKILKMLSEVHNVSAFESEPEFFSTCQQILSQKQNQPDGKKSYQQVNLLLLHLLSRMIAKSEIIRIFLTEQVNLLSTLADLVAMMATDEEQRAILDLASLLTCNMHLERVEAFVTQWVPHAINLSESENNALAARSLQILIGLSRKCYPVKRFIAQNMTTDHQKNLCINHSSADQQLGQGANLQILKHHLFLVLSTLNLSFNLLIFTPKHTEPLLTMATDVFCTSYSNEDFVLMKTVNHFLEDLNAERMTVNLDSKFLCSLIQQVALVADFSQSNFSNQLFKFTRHISSFSSELLDLKDLVLKLVLLRLDSGSPLEATESLKIAKEIISNASDKMESWSNVSAQNFNLQLEPVIFALCNLSTSSLGGSSAREKKGLKTVFDALLKACSVQSWKQLVSNSLKSKIVAKRIEISCDKTSHLIPVVGLLNLTLELSKNCVSSSQPEEEENDWSELSQKILRDEKIKSRILKGLQISEDTWEKLQIVNILKSPNIPFDWETTEEGGERRKSEEDNESFLSNPQFPKQTLKEIDFVLDKVTSSLEQNKIFEDLAEIVELNEMRIESNTETQNILKQSLRLADERITFQNNQIFRLDQEILKMRHILNKSLLKSQSLQNESEDIRKQYEKSQKEITKYKSQMHKEIESKKSEIISYENEIKNLGAKMMKYKTLNDSLQETIAQHMQTQEELQSKLNSELKSKSELNAALQKKDEKLKKKEILFEEETAKRHKLESDYEELKKEIQNLQSLTNRQQQALNKKDKQIQEQNDELEAFKSIQEQFFNISKRVGGKK